MKLNISSRRWTDEQGTPRLFRYYLLVDTVDTGRFCCEEYGVCVEDDLEHTTSIPAITTSASRIDQLLALLVKHLVGPAGVADVVADWL